MTTTKQAVAIKPATFNLTVPALRAQKVRHYIGNAWIKASPALDQTGQPVMDENGEQVVVQHMNFMLSKELKVGDNKYACNSITLTSEQVVQLYPNNNRRTENDPHFSVSILLEPGEALNFN